VRGCEYAGQEPRRWAIDIIPAGSVEDDALKQDLLGARRKIVFVEGTHQSLDLPLYSLLFPGVSIIPKASCRDVEQAVRGLRGASEMHWAQVWGVIDNDQRASNDVSRLREAGVWALSHYSVESYYFHPHIVRRVAARNASVLGGDVAATVKTALSEAVTAAAKQKGHFVRGAVLRAARRKLVEGIPDKDSVAASDQISINIDLTDLRREEEKRFDTLIAAGDWDGLVARYPLRESLAFSRIVKSLKIADVPTYQDAVLKLLQDDPEALSEIRALMHGLYDEVCVSTKERGSTASPGTNFSTHAGKSQ
jgi:hypothetical protein